MIFFSGVQLICFGLMGQYIGRIYDEAKGRPIFIVADDTAGVPDGRDGNDAVTGAAQLDTTY